MSTDPLLGKMTPRVERAVAKMQAALTQLRETLQQDIYMEDTPLEVQAVMENAASAIETALRSNGGVLVTRDLRYPQGGLPGVQPKRQAPRSGPVSSPTLRPTSRL